MNRGGNGDANGDGNGGGNGGGGKVALDSIPTGPWSIPKT